MSAPKKMQKLQTKQLLFLADLHTLYNEQFGFASIYCALK